jgi:hypothetical protein
MEDVVQMLAAVLRVAIVPAIGYAIVQLARRWPWATLILLVALIAGGTGALAYAADADSAFAWIPARWSSGRRLAGGVSESERCW